ncbi:hypothetical protein HGO40_07270 [Pseudomonas sp. CG7]|uniref:hypothetical protein n=1 Tax=Pseudomonas sp. CG7 TaxID=191007 RepID=UPI0020334D48|nr:hypothetical protein [Pseudomonas sp. CG7]MCM2460296.1 hypothetical protein [Pseudomonas sp. CG7]
MDHIDHGHGAVLVPPMADYISATAKRLAEQIALELKDLFDLGRTDLSSINKAALCVCKNNANQTRRLEFGAAQVPSNVDAKINILGIQNASRDSHFYFPLPSIF